MLALDLRVLKCCILSFFQHSLHVSDSNWKRLRRNALYILHPDSSIELFVSGRTLTFLLLFLNGS